MDMALLIRDLVSLLEAYSAACLEPDGNERLELADAILQGLSADPELLLTRLDLLGPSTMIEDLFSARGEDGEVRYTPAGQAHRECLEKYAALIGQAAASLKKDALSLDPAHAVYSPLGVVYGFCADILSNMVLNTLHASSSADLSLEDTFISLGRLEQKRAQAQEWQCLPKAEGERDAFEYSTEWAAAMFARMVSGLEARAARPTEPNASAFPASRLYVVPRGATIDSWPEGVLPAGIVSAQEHCLTSDVTRARDTAAHRAVEESIVHRQGRGTISRQRRSRRRVVRRVQGPADNLHEPGERRANLRRPPRRDRCAPPDVLGAPGLTGPAAFERRAMTRARTKGLAMRLRAAWCVAIVDSAVVFRMRCKYRGAAALHHTSCDYCRRAPP